MDKSKIVCLDVENVNKMIEEIRASERQVFERIQEKNRWEAKEQQQEGNGDFWLDMQLYLKELQDTEATLIVLKSRMDSMEGY